MSGHLKVGDFVKDLTFDPPIKGRINDEVSPGKFLVHLTDGREVTVRGHNLEYLPKRPGACTNFLDDGRGCCRTCGHFHGPAGEA